MCLACRSISASVCLEYHTFEQFKCMFVGGLWLKRACIGDSQWLFRNALNGALKKLPFHGQIRCCNTWFLARVQDSYGATPFSQSQPLGPKTSSLSSLRHFLSRRIGIRCLFVVTSSTAQGGGGSFKKRKTIGEIGCCESRMSKQKHWPID